MDHLNNRIDQLFADKKADPILSIFYTAGFPGLSDTVTLAKTIQEAGADMIEIGIPFSDPIADGPTIQASSKRALDNGMNVTTLMTQLASLREHVDIPVLLMGYINPILQYGMERFCTTCKAYGVDGLIVPDLPFDMYGREYMSHFTTNDLHYIALVTPQTSEERIRKIDAVGGGFIYAVSSASTTGSNNKINNTENYLSRLNKMHLQHPILVGFNIKTYDDLQFVGQYHPGGIIGSAFLNHIADEEDPHQAAHQFITQIKYNR